MCSEETSELDSRGMIQHVQTVCGNETSEARADRWLLAKARPPDVYITLVGI